MNSDRIPEDDAPQGEVDEYGDDGREIKSNRIPPRVLFASYAMVGGAYVAVIMLILLATAVVSYLFFPETFELLGSAPEVVKAAVAENPTALMPTDMFWILWVFAGLVSFSAGWLVSRFAVFAKLGHAIFLAVLLFVTYLQLAITQTPDMRWAPILMAGVCSIATAFGAKRQLDRNPAQ